MHESERTLPRGLFELCSIDGLWNLLHDRPFVVQTMLLPFRLCQNCRSGSQEWLFIGPDVCLVTMALLQSIVTQNMCFYGHNADHCHVPSSSSCRAAEVNCFDDLFVPTDVIQFSISIFICTVHASLWDRIAVYGSSKCVLSRTNC